MLMVLSGLPDTGTSTLAREVVRRLGAVYLRVDTVEAALLNAGYTNITFEGYAAAYAIAADNLSLGLSVVADCVNPVAETREAWANVARQSDKELVNVEVICSDRAEHRRRVDLRYGDPLNLVGKWAPPNWKAVENWSFQPWQRPVLVVDTAHKTVSELASTILNSISNS